MGKLLNQSIEQGNERVLNSKFREIICQIVDELHFVAREKIQNCAIHFLVVIFFWLNVYLTPYVMRPLMIQLVFQWNSHA